MCLCVLSTVFILVNDKALMDGSIGEINSIDTIGLVCGV